MLKWDTEGPNLVLKGLVMQGKESSIIVYSRYENNYIFSCNELGIPLKLIEAESIEEVENIVATIVKERLNSLILDISQNLTLLGNENFVSQDVLEKQVQAHRYCA